MIFDIILMIEYLRESCRRLFLSQFRSYTSIFVTYTRDFLLLFNLPLIKRCSSGKWKALPENGYVYPPRGEKGIPHDCRASLACSC